MPYYFSSCEEEKEIVHPIVGEWEWYRSCLGWAGETTPEDIDTSLTFIFFEDERFTILENSDTAVSGEYYIGENENYFGEKLDFLHFHGDSGFIAYYTYFMITPVDSSLFNRYYIINLTDTLHLSDGVDDGMDIWFKRSIN